MFSYKPTTFYPREIAVATINLSIMCPFVVKFLVLKKKKFVLANWDQLPHYHTCNEVNVIQAYLQIMIVGVLIKYKMYESVQNFSTLENRSINWIKIYTWLDLSQLLCTWHTTAEQNQSKWKQIKGKMLPVSCVIPVTPERQHQNFRCLFFLICKNLLIHISKLVGVRYTEARQHNSKISQFNQPFHWTCCIGLRQGSKDMGIDIWFTLIYLLSGLLAITKNLSDCRLWQAGRGYRKDSIVKTSGKLYWMQIFFLKTASSYSPSLKRLFSVTYLVFPVSSPTDERVV